MFFIHFVASLPNTTFSSCVVNVVHYLIIYILAFKALYRIGLDLILYNV